VRWSSILKIFFDVDGVIIEGWHDKPERRRPWDTTIKEDLGVDRDAFRKTFFGLPFATSTPPMHFCAKGERDLKEALAAVLPSVGYRGPVDTFVRYWFERDSHINHAVLDVVKLLASHTDAELYLATGQERYRAAYLWDELGFKEYFLDIFYSAKLGCSKNEREFFEKINYELGVAAEIERGDRPLFFDDTEAVVNIARSCGWDAYTLEDANTLWEHPKLKNLLERVIDS
jgi:putative hydrolase of the HAD superfamily